MLSKNMKTARVLCVDDEPKVLEGLQRVLHRRCVFLSASGGEDALKLIARSEHIDVVVSDMRMPEMNGAVFLAECRKRSPDTVRLLLTGQADLASAIDAVNEGQVFRFLTKPCPPEQFLEAIVAAVEKGRLAVSERELLERTVEGSVRALTEVIELIHPGTLGSSSRQLERARKVAAQLHVANAWHVEVAAVLSHAGYVILPNDLLARVNAGSALNTKEQGMLVRVPLVLTRVLSGIPHLDVAQRALKYQDRPFESRNGDLDQEDLPIGSRILKALSDLATEEARFSGTSNALAELRSRPGTYDPSVLDAIAAVCTPPGAGPRSLRQ
jgi:CheY-like chemotaxis protein